MKRIISMRKIIFIATLVFIIKVQAYAEEAGNTSKKPVLDADASYSFFLNAGKDYKTEDISPSRYTVSENFFITRNFTAGVKVAYAKTKFENDGALYKRNYIESERKGYGAQLQYFFAKRFKELQSLQDRFCPFIGVAYLIEREKFKYKYASSDYTRSSTETYDGHSIEVFGGVGYLLTNNIALTLGYSYQNYEMFNKQQWDTEYIFYDISSVLAGIKVFL
jgi:opacity protein-like surface antigen